MNKKPYDDLWGNLVAAVCEEFQDGTLEFIDAVEDLLFLGCDDDEAFERLHVVATAGLVSYRSMSKADHLPQRRNGPTPMLERRYSLKSVA